MESRLHINSGDKDFFCETKDNLDGMTFLENLRKTDPRFKRQRIRAIIQAHPDQVELNKITNTYYIG